MKENLDRAKREIKAALLQAEEDFSKLERRGDDRWRIRTSPVARKLELVIIAIEVAESIAKPIP